MIGNRNSIRFSHPKPDRLGKKMVGGDNAPALEQGKSYISQAIGTLGPSIRGKAPIYSDYKEIIGIVSVGYLLEDVKDIVHNHQARVGTLVAILILVGVAGAISISGRFKKAILVLNLNRSLSYSSNEQRLSNLSVKGSSPSTAMPG